MSKPTDIDHFLELKAIKNTNEYIKALFVEYGFEPHWCGEKQCEASNNTAHFMNDLSNYIQNERVKARIDELQEQINTFDWDLGIEKFIDRIAELKGKPSNE